MTPRTFAIEAHGDQQYGTHPYVYHLDAVYAVLAGFGFTDERILRAAYLHDVLEDTEITFDAIQREFGLKVAQVVSGVTNEPGKNRAERHRLTYPKIAADPDAVILKLADRIANVRESLFSSPSLMKMYTREYPEFRLALHQNATAASALWHELDRLCQERS